MSRTARRRAAVLLTLALLALGAPHAVGQDDEPTITSQVITSFDGTEIFSTLFLPPGTTEDDPVPLVMRTHGWGGTGETTVGGTLERLLDAGYAVVTWDQRGFGQSGDVAHVDKPEFEGRDAMAVLDWVVANAPIAEEAPGDPVVGMTGGSYAGGIQTATASIDPRIDAIAPEISWSDLRYSLYENGVVNFAWSQLLFVAGAATAGTGGLNPGNATGVEPGIYAPELAQAEIEGLLLGTPSESSLEFFADSSLDHYGIETPVSVPTLVMNGSVDTLFDLSDGYRIHRHVRDQGIPSRYIAFCGGHVACPASYAELDDRRHLDEAILTWFARYLRGEDVDTGPTVEYRTNEGVWRGVEDFTGTDVATASLEASLVQTGLPDPSQAQGLPTIALPSTDGDPQMASVEVLAADDGPVDLLGMPTLEIEVSGQGTLAHVFAKLVHREAREVVNLQETPLRVDLTADPEPVTLEMSGIAYTLPEGDHLDLQVTTTSLMHLPARVPAQVEVAATVSVPTRQAPLAVERVAGDDRIATAIAASRHQHPLGGADTAVIARQDVAADALAVGPLADRLDAPVLLTPRDQLDARVAGELDRLLGEGAGTVLIAGGEAAISPAVEQALADTGRTVERVGGATRFDTAAQIADHPDAGGGPVHLADGGGYAPALLAGSAATTIDGVVLLTDGATMPTATATWLEAAGDREVVAIGDAAVTADPEAQAIPGADPAALSVAVAEHAWEDPTAVHLASADDFPDALASIPLAGPGGDDAGGPLLLVPADGALPEPIATYLGEAAVDVDRVLVVGGVAAIGQAVVDAVVALLAG
ncbi:cell wall-binding repeat-containing protein [Euzebya sp.]|uniref:cell wall-binding repeat-containing protein n=1 Tax=Euzebya sp. TaxID=1971409 RepID=UPI00351903D9